MIFRTGKQSRGPHYDLETFKAALHADRFHVYAGSALDVVARLLKCGRLGAREYVRQVGLSLEQGDFAHTLRHPNGAVQDVYGKRVEAEGWYVKFEIDVCDGEAGIISCHPAEHDLQTRRGTVPRTRRRWLR